MTSRFGMQLYDNLMVFCGSYLMLGSTGQQLLEPFTHIGLCVFVVRRVVRGDLALSRSFMVACSFGFLVVESIWMATVV